jgi:hypothetical protein
MFINDGYSGIELENALHAHARMGYNFVVSKVGAIFPDSLRDDRTVQVDVTVTQVGVAPFYYPLSLFFDCPDLTRPREMKGVERLVAEGDTKTFSFTNIPRTTTCMKAVSLYLNSTYAYSGRPIKFAQGQTGTVQIHIPLPTSYFNDSPDDSNQLYLVWNLINTNANAEEGNVELESGTFIDLAQVGRSITIRADVFNSDGDLQTRNIAVNFQYTDIVHVERWHPYVLNGNKGKNYKNSDYLNTVGTKTIKATVTNKIDKSILLKRTIIFDILDTENVDAMPVPTPTIRSMSEVFSPSLFVSSSEDEITMVPTKSPIRMISPTTDEKSDYIHGFNTPSTPPLLVLEERRRSIAFRNHVIFPLVFVTFIVLSSMLCFIYRRRRRTIHCQDEPVSPYGDLLNEQTKKSDPLTDDSIALTIVST